MAGTSLGTAYVQVIPSAQGIKGSISNALNGEAVAGGKMAGGKIATAIKGVILAAGIGVALKSALTEGAALEQSLGGVETLYKEHSSIIIENAKKAWKTAGVSANEYMEQSTTFAASLLSSLGGDTAKAAKYADMAIVDMADNSNKMGTSLEMIQNAYSGFSRGNFTMLDNLKLGFAGTKQGMQDLLDKASEISGKKYDISNLADIYDAIHVMQKSLGITGTTAKEAESTLSGSLASFKSAWKNLLGEITVGGELQQPMMDLAKSFGTYFFKNLIPALGNIGSGIMQLMYMAGDYMIQNKDIIASKGLDMVASLAVNIVKAAPKLITGFLMLFGGIEEIVAAAGRKLIHRIGSKISSAWGAVITGFKKKVGELKDTILSKFPFSLGKIFKIKLPKLSITDGKAPYGWKGKGSMPSFGIKWMAKGGIVDTATLIGAGEAGAEAIVPLDEFWNRLESNGNGGTVTVIMNLDGKTIGQSTVNYINGQTLQFNANPIML